MTAPAAAPTFESLVNVLLAAGFSREVAEREVRKQHPHLVAMVTDAVDERKLNLLEKDEQAYIAKLFRGFGCKVYNLSQARASKQTPGLPDLWVVHRERRIAFWFETKRSSGSRIRPEQLDFLRECTDVGVRMSIGDRRDAARLLVQLGLARVGEGPCGIVPFHEAP